MRKNSPPIEALYEFNAQLKYVIQKHPVYPLRTRIRKTDIQDVCGIPKKKLYKINQSPLKSTPSNTNDGMRQEEERRGSFPVSTKEDQRASILPVTFISETG